MIGLGTCIFLHGGTTWIGRAHVELFRGVFEIIGGVGLVEGSEWRPRMVSQIATSPGRCPKICGNPDLSPISTSIHTITPIPTWALHCAV